MSAPEFIPQPLELAARRRPTPLDPEISSEERTRATPRWAVGFSLLAIIFSALLGAYWAWQLAPDDRQLATGLAQSLAEKPIGDFRGTLQASPERRFNWQLSGTVGPQELRLVVNDRPLVDINSQRLSLFPGKSGLGGRAFPLPGGPTGPPLVVWDNLAGVVSSGPILGGRKTWRLLVNSQQASQILPGFAAQRMVIFVDAENNQPRRIVAQWQISAQQAKKIGLQGGNQRLDLQLNFQSWRATIKTSKR